MSSSMRKNSNKLVFLRNQWPQNNLKKRKPLLLFHQNSRILNLRNQIIFLTSGKTKNLFLLTTYGKFTISTKILLMLFMKTIWKNQLNYSQIFLKSLWIKTKKRLIYLSELLMATIEQCPSSCLSLTLLNPNCR